MGVLKTEDFRGYSSIEKLTRCKLHAISSQTRKLIIPTTVSAVNVLLVNEIFQCLPACERTENYWQMTSSIDTSPSPKYAFRVEASFNDLEVGPSLRNLLFFYRFFSHFSV